METIRPKLVELGKCTLIVAFAERTIKVIHITFKITIISSKAILNHHLGASKETIRKRFV